MAKHPFEGTPQHAQQYDDFSGAGGREGNGLGDVWGGESSDEATSTRRGERPSVHFDAAAYSDEYFAEEPPDVDVGALLLALDTLTERQRFVIECRYGLRAGSEGQRLSLRDIAALMGTSHVTVVEHEQAALTKLRRALS
jgi:DNA-directed RNA polymerase specialized sigma subunit